MKKTRYVLLVSAGALLLIGCYSNRPREYSRSPDTHARYSYVYYPEDEVYYYPPRRIYYWSDGRSWRSGSRAPSNYALRSYVTITHDSTEPYRYHDQVRVQYPRPPDAYRYGDRR